MAQTAVRKAMVAESARREGRWAEVASGDTGMGGNIIRGKRDGEFEEKRLHRDHGGHRVRREELRRRKLEAFDRKSPPLQTKGGAPSSTFWLGVTSANPRAQSGM